MTQSVRIEGENATLVIDDEDMPADALVSWSAAHVAALVAAGYRTGNEAGRTRVLAVAAAHPELFAKGGAPSFEAAASADISLRETTFVRDATGKITGTVERTLTPHPRRRSTDRDE